MGLINWLKQKIFHKKDEDKKEGKPVEPVVEENLKSEEAKDKTSGESVVEKTLEGNKVDEEPIYEVKKEETKEESLQPEVVKEEQSVEQSIEDKVETKEEPVVEENTLEESVQPEVKEEQKIEEQPVEENKVEDNSSIKDEEKYEPSKENKQSSFEEPVVEENTLEEPVQPEVKEEQKIEEQPVEENKVEDNSSIKDEEKYEPSKENKQSSFEEPVIQNNTDGIENNNEFEYSNPLLDLVLEDKLEKKESKVEVNDEQPIEDKAETKEEPLVEKELSDEPVQPEIKEEQHAEENKVEENSSIKDEEAKGKTSGESVVEITLEENKVDEEPIYEVKKEEIKEESLQPEVVKEEQSVEQPIEDKAETKEEPVVEENTLEEPVQPEVKEDQRIEEQPVEEKENEEDEDEVIEEKEEQTKEAEQVNSTDEPVIEKKNDEATTKKIEVDHETKIYNLGLAKSREGFGARLNSIANKYKEANSDYFDELERCLIEADVGVNLTMSVLDETEKMAASQHLDNPKEINDLLVDNLFMNYAKSGDSFQTEIKFDPENPTVLLMVGVNGTGKTTTIAKLAKHYKELGKKVMLVAADTFRAGAVQQLSIWANRIGVDIFERGQGADPASVCFDAIKKAINEKYDLVMVDTAGRLHTKDYLMAELGKVNRVIKKVLPVAPQEIWLALDANTGQNGVQQAKVFKEVTPLTGVVITKMDGTSKGGIILAIRDQLGVPVRFIGLGEHEDDLREFDLDRYLYALLVGEDENFEE